MSTGQRIIKNSIFLILSQIFSKIFNFGLILVLTRLLGTSGYGLYSFSFSYVSLFVVLTHLGITNLLVREIARNKEEIVLVNLRKISEGTQPDFFIKPNDVVNIGSHPTARWRAILRNAFRATYGFGFIYDRNFADRDVGTRRPVPDWF